MKTYIIFLSAIFVLLPLATVEAQWLTPQQQRMRMQAQGHTNQRVVAEMIKHENNIRSLSVVLSNREIRARLRTTEMQNKDLAELSKKYDELRDQIINPEGKQLKMIERMDAVKANRDALMELSLRCGSDVRMVLTPAQFSFFSRNVNHLRAKHAWEMRMGIEPERPVIDDPIDNKDRRRRAR